MYYFYFNVIVFIQMSCYFSFYLIFNIYTHNDVFSFEKSLINQNHSLNSHNPIKNTHSKIPLSLSLLSIWKTLVHFRVFIVSTIYVIMIADLFFLCTNDSCLLYQHTMSNKLGENLNKKL